MALSEPHLHKSACSLADEEHVINDSFLEVIEEVASRAQSVGIDLDWGAAGCGSCFHIDEDEYDGAIFWIAQNDAYDTVPLNYDVNEDCSMTRLKLGDLICDVADDLHVLWSWTRNATKCVFLGTERKFYNYEPGDRVKETSRSGREGTVLSPDTLYDDTKYRVWDQRDYDGIGHGGELIARFVDRSHAEAFLARTYGVDTETLGKYDDDQPFDIESIIEHGNRDGSNIVILDGSTKPSVMSSENLKDAQ